MLPVLVILLYTYTHITWLDALNTQERFRVDEVVVALAVIAGRVAVDLQHL